MWFCGLCRTKTLGVSHGHALGGAHGLNPHLSPALQTPEQCPPEILDLIHDCMLVDAARRPTAKQIFDRLKVRALSACDSVQAPLLQKLLWGRHAPGLEGALLRAWGE